MRLRSGYGNDASTIMAMKATAVIKSIGKNLLTKTKRGFGAEWDTVSYLSFQHLLLKYKPFGFVKKKNWSSKCLQGTKGTCSRPPAAKYDCSEAWSSLSVVSIACSEGCGASRSDGLPAANAGAVVALKLYEAGAEDPLLAWDGMSDDVSERERRHCRKSWDARSPIASACKSKSICTHTYQRVFFKKKTGKAPDFSLLIMMTTYIWARPASAYQLRRADVKPTSLWICFCFASFNMRYTSSSEPPSSWIARTTLCPVPATAPSRKRKNIPASL